MTSATKASAINSVDSTREVERLDVAQLGALLRERRGNLSLRQAAAAANVSFSTFSRVEAGSQPDLTSFLLLCAWLGLPPSQFFASVAPREEAPLEVAIAHLSSDPRLEAEQAGQIAEVMRNMYIAFAKTQASRPVVACHLRAAAVMRPGVSTRLSSILRELNDKLAAEIAAGRL